MGIGGSSIALVMINHLEIVTSEVGTVIGGKTRQKTRDLIEMEVAAARVIPERKGDDWRKNDCTRRKPLNARKTGSDLKGAERSTRKKEG